MDNKLNQLNSKTTSMHYLDVIEWIKNKAEDFEQEVLLVASFFFEKEQQEQDLLNKVKARVQAIFAVEKELK